MTAGILLGDGPISPFLEKWHLYFVPEKFVS